MGANAAPGGGQLNPMTVTQAVLYPKEVAKLSTLANYLYPEDIARTVSSKPDLLELPLAGIWSWCIPFRVTECFPKPRTA